jgi:hypothetical protein
MAVDSRWGYRGRTVWKPGENVPALRRGGGPQRSTLNAAGMQLIGNFLTNAEKIPKELRSKMCVLMTDRQVGNVDSLSFVAIMGGVSRKTMRSWRVALDRHRWQFSVAHGADNADKPQCEPLAAPQCEPLAAQSAATLPPEPNFEEGPVNDDEERDLGEVGEQGGAVPIPLEDMYRVGIRMAELATMWHVHGWSKCEFPQFMLWARENFPHMLGNLNHSTRFLHDFLPSLAAAGHVCTSASLHAIVPALGLPSLLTRVIDIVSVKSRSLLPTIHIYTNTKGALSWALAGCPCLEYVEVGSGSSVQAVGCASSQGASSQNVSNNFGFHKAPQIVKSVHQVEEALGIKRDDRAWRVVCTVGDQAIQGPGSVRFSKRECQVDGLPEDPHSEGICQFHVADGVGCHVDGHFPETQLYDRMLRLVKRAFAWGTGDLILRALAEKFKNIAADFDERAVQLDREATDFEVQGKPLAADRCRQRAAKERAEASALRRTGWTKWRRPAAPSADGTRKVVWQTRSRESFFQLYGLIFWGIKTRMQQTVDNAREACASRGQQWTGETGLRTKEMKAWRSLGRAVTDVRVLVFNLGRVDFRRKHLTAYALEVQSSLSSVAAERSLEVCEQMFTAIGVLVHMRAVVLLVQRLCRGLTLVSSAGRCVITNKGSPKLTTLWLVARTLLAHKCWRLFPALSVRLPEILLGGSFRGVRLQTDDFVEPDSCSPLSENKWERARRHREERCDQVIHAIDRLIAWAKAERREFAVRLVGVQMQPQRKVCQAVGVGSLPYVPDWSSLDVASSSNSPSGATASQSAPASSSSSSKTFGHCKGEGESLQPLAQASQLAEKSRCSFKPRPATTSKSGCSASLYVDLLGGDAFCQNRNAVQDAAVELDTELRNTWGSAVQLSPEALSSVLCTVGSEQCEEKNVEIFGLGRGPEFADSSSESEEHDEQKTFEPQPLASGAPSMCLESQPLASGALSMCHGCDVATAEAPSIPGDPEKRATVSHGWVVSRIKATGRWRFVPWAQHQQEFRNLARGDAHSRTHFLNLCGPLFGASLVAVADDGAVEYLRPAIAALATACEGRVWGHIVDDGEALGSLRRGRVQHQRLSAAKLPQEVFQLVTVDELVSQYTRLRSWLRSFKTLPYGHEFYKPICCILQHVEGTRGCFHEEFKNIIEASRWPPRYVPPVGSKVHSKARGACVIKHVLIEPDMQRHYEHSMSTPLEEVRCRGIWNILVAWHYYTHVSATSESLAESVGSILSSITKFNHNRQLRVQHIVWAAQLRALGLRGMGGEEGILSMALNYHFKCDGPSGWHFFAKRPAAGGKQWQRVLRDVRLSRRPPWFGSPLHDLINQRELILYKPLPNPESFLMHREEFGEHRKLGATAQRKRKQELGELKWEPRKLADELWKKIKVSATSLPPHLRPGAKPR